MSQALIRMELGDSYPYKVLRERFGDKELTDYRASLIKKYSTMAGAWTDELHSEWTARMYLGCKMIFSATLLLNTIVYSRRKNLRITEPYLLYYSIFNCCRALGFAHPAKIWRNGNLITESHTKVIDGSVEIVNRLDTQVGADLLHLLKEAKDYRELFSYKYPSNGLIASEFFGRVTIENIIAYCTLLCELAQYTSEAFQHAYDKKCGGAEYSYDQQTLAACLQYRGDTYFMQDDEDAYRVAYIIRKARRPFNMYYTMTEGMVEDFFGSWCSDGEEGEDEDGFDPDKQEVNIFSFP